MDGILSTIGQTPLIELRRISQNTGIRVLAKLEGFNPGGSAKDRAALEIITNAIKSGLIQPETVIIESSSGNMGIGIAQVCRYFGLRFICVVDPHIMTQNVRILRAYGAEVDFVTEPDPVTGQFLPARINRVRELLASNSHSFWPNQYANPNNSGAHYRGTIREILEALDQRLDYLFCSVSTCGTLRGCSDYLRDHGHHAKVIAIDAEGSLVFGNNKPGKRRLPGLGAGIRPPLCDPTGVHQVVYVSDADCISGCRRLVREEAILVGASSGGVLKAIERLIPAFPEGTICVGIFPDRGERYMEVVYDDQWVHDNIVEFTQGQEQNHRVVDGRN